jgi:hypothetical protein
MDSDEIIEVVCRELATGRSLQDTGALVGLSKYAVQRLVRDLDVPRRRKTRMTRRERRNIIVAILSTNLSRRELGRQFSRSPATVQRLANHLMGRASPKQAPARIRSPRRCSVCGALVSQWPCVACVVRGSNAASR